MSASARPNLQTGVARPGGVLSCVPPHLRALSFERGDLLGEAPSLIRWGVKHKLVRGPGPAPAAPSAARSVVEFGLQQGLLSMPPKDPRQPRQPKPRLLAQRPVKDREMRVWRILSEVGREYGVTIDLLRGSRGVEHVCLARAVAAFLLRHDLGLTLEAVGEELRRGHCAMVRAVDRVAERMGDPAMSDRVKRIVARLKGGRL